jgi:hypothetical protein
LNDLDLLIAGGQYGRFQAACDRSDLIAGLAARFAAAQVVGRSSLSSLGRVMGRRSMRFLRSTPFSPPPVRSPALSGASRRKQSPSSQLINAKLRL